MQVNLEYYKEDGNYYSGGTYNSTKLSIIKIADEVREMDAHPGLPSGYWVGSIKIYAWHTMVEIKTTEKKLSTNRVHFMQPCDRCKLRIGCHYTIDCNFKTDYPKFIPVSGGVSVGRGNTVEYF